MKSLYFGGGEIKKLRSCLIAQRGEYFAHGSSFREAVSDVNFKFLQSNLDVADVVADVVATKSVTVIQYRLLTGACQEGCRRFLDDNGIPPEMESLPLPRVLELTRNSFGGDKIRRLFREESK